MTLPSVSPATDEDLVAQVNHFRRGVEEDGRPGILQFELSQLVVEPYCIEVGIVEPFATFFEALPPNLNRNREVLDVALVVVRLDQL